MYIECSARIMQLPQSSKVKSVIEGERVNPVHVTPLWPEVEFSPQS